MIADMKSPDLISAFWDKFLKETKRNATEKYFECFYFDNTEESANYLLSLVLNGKKKATASSALSFECSNSPLPKVGDLSIVTDWGGKPHCVIKTTNVTILPFQDITFDICKREGEDDSLKSWQEGHVNFFMEDGKSEGYKFTWDMPVVFEDFEVIYTV